MKKLKLYHAALLPVLFLCCMWLFSTAFSFISAPSDSLVTAGVILLSMTLLAIASLIIYIKNTYF